MTIEALSRQTLEIFGSTASPEFVELLTAVLTIILALLLANIALLVGTEVGGRMNGYPGRGLELFQREVEWFINLFFGGSE